MKIVITVEDFNSSRGYLEYYLAKELAKQGHEVFVFTFNQKRTLKIKAVDGFQVFFLPYLTMISDNRIPTISGVKCISRFIKSEAPDIVHCQPLFSPLSLIFIGFQRLSNYRIVGSLISGGPRITLDLLSGSYHSSSTVSSLKIGFIRILIRCYLKRKTDLFFAINKGFKKLLVHLLNIPSDRICIIPLGADPSLFKFDAKARTQIRKLLSISTNDVVVSFFGRIIQPKGLHSLIRALEPIVKKYPYVKLLLIGEGDRDYISHLMELSSKLEMTNSVIFHPSLHRTKLFAYYSASDIAVWPGGLSISIIEAASTSLPLIVTRSPINRYVIAYDNGFEFQYDDVDGLQSVLELLIKDDKLRREMGRRSRLLVEQKLNWRHIASLFLNEYKRVLERM